jgi:hypothetical protein
MKFIHPNDQSTSIFIQNSFIRFGKNCSSRSQTFISHVSSKLSFIRLSSSKIPSIHSEPTSRPEKVQKNSPCARGSLAFFPMSLIFPYGQKSSYGPKSSVCLLSQLRITGKSFNFPRVEPHTGSCELAFGRGWGPCACLLAAREYRMWKCV